MNSLFSSVFRFFGSLGLTVALLFFSIVLVFFGTLDQVQWGIHHTQELYFESWYVLTPFLSLFKVFTSHFFDPDLAHIVFPLPGGKTLGALLLVNLTCAHFRYFKPSWKKVGIVVLHFGVLLLLVSGFLTAAMQEESNMQLDEGGPPVNYSTSFHHEELVLIDRSGATDDIVTSVPFTMLYSGKPIELPNGFKVIPHAAMQNAGAGMRASLLGQYQQMASGGANMSESQFRQVNRSITSLSDPSVIVIAEDGAPILRSDGLELKGFAPRMGGILQEQPPTFAQDERNLGAAVVEVIAPGGKSQGSWLLSSGFGPGIPPQGFVYEGKRYDIAVRFKRHYLPYTLQLEDFKHDLYPGTQIPKNFSSDVVIDNPETGENRPVLIYMNHPLRYEGLTFFQASFANEDKTSILQVVRNPYWTLPYWAVLMVGLGMTIQFGISLSRFVSRLKKKAAA
ncbi:MAG: cytochrome c biogenesis protein ResB [Verrucomicrobiota bacterium]